MLQEIQHKGRMLQHVSGELEGGALDNLGGAPSDRNGGVAAGLVDSRAAEHGNTAAAAGSARALASSSASFAGAGGGLAHSKSVVRSILGMETLAQKLEKLTPRKCEFWGLLGLWPLHNWEGCVRCWHLESDGALSRNTPATWYSQTRGMLDTYETHTRLGLTGNLYTQRLLGERRRVEPSHQRGLAERWEATGGTGTCSLQPTKASCRCVQTL